MLLGPKVVYFLRIATLVRLLACTRNTARKASVAPGETMFINPVNSRGSISARRFLLSKRLINLLDALPLDNGTDETTYRSMYHPINQRIDRVYEEKLI